MEFIRSEQVIQIFLKVINRYIATEKRPCDYGVGCLMYRSEIHSIDAIGKHVGANITELAALLGITKSAASQMTDRLIKKGMVTKTVLSKSDTEVALTLTENGEKVYVGHNEYHRELYRYLDQELSEVSDEDLKSFTNIMGRLANLLEENSNLNTEI